MKDKLNEIMQRIEQNRANAQPHIQPVYECDKCKDTEFILHKENGREYATRCSCWETKAAARIMRNSGISEEDSKKGFREFETFGESALVDAKDKATRYFMEFFQNESSRTNSIMLCGASGRGKTTLGMAIANNLIHKCVGVRYMAYRDEITRLKQEITEEHTYNEHMRRLQGARVLFIDDMLKGKVTESDVNILYEIINHRYLSRLPMIISTEKTPQELIEFDEAIASRLLEMSKGYVVVFDKSVPNYRLRNFF